MSVADELDKLNAMRDDGTISHEQYERAKAKLLDKAADARDRDEEERAMTCDLECQHCRARFTFEATASQSRHTVECPECNETFEVLLCRIRAKRSRGNRKFHSREFDVRLVRRDGGEELIRFWNGDHRDFELRQGDEVALYYHNHVLLAIHNFTIGELYEITRPPSEWPPSQWAMLLHLSLLAGHVVPFGGVIAPIVIWQTKKDEMPELDEHGKNAVNWLLSAIIYALVCIPLCFIVVGFVLLFALAVLHVVFPIIAAVKANEGRVWKYPLAIPFFK